MVQVDVFWSYAIGAGFATAAAARLATTAPPSAPRPRARLDDPYLTTTLLYLGCLFAPSGIWLLWQFTGWETMHVARPADLPGWLVAAFALTNVTQGVLGYAVARRLWRRGHRYLSWLQMPLGYLAMFFILAHGWDGTGYRRFFAATTDGWRSGHFDPVAFLTSDVALTLYGMGVALVPVLLWLQSSWWGGGAGRLRFAALILAAIFGVGLGTAVAATVLLLAFGPLAGGAGCAALLVAVLHPRGAAGALARRFGLTA